MAGRLDGKVALLTGAAGGIGSATARLFCREGARVSLVDVDGDGLERLARALTAELPGAQVAPIAADISQEKEAAQAVEQTLARFGTLQVLVNNAATREIGPLAETTEESWRRILGVNVLGVVNCCKAAMPSLRASGRASVVNVASVYAVVGRAGWGQYDATKAAVVALTRTLAVEEARHGIRVNAVCPGSTLTPFTLGRAAARGMTEDELRARGSAPSLLGRWAEAEEVAYPILWLASDEASFVTGATLMVDGGLSAT